MKMADRGRIGFARTYVREQVPQWIVLHFQTMDGASATHAKQLSIPD